MMNSLENYGSDDELQRSRSNFQQGGGKYKVTEQDTNYDNLTMEMSEESSHNEPSSPRSNYSDSSSSSSSSSSTSSSYDDYDKRSKDKHHDDYDDRSYHSDSPDYTKGSRDRDSDKRRKPYREDYHRGRDDRRSRRSSRSSRSRSPSYHRSRRSRSRSRDRSRHSRREYHSPSRRRRDHYDRSRPGIGGPPERKPSKLSILEKLGIELKLPEGDKDNPSLSLPSYYNPVAMNPAKYAEQIAKRKLLWGNAQKQKQSTGETAEKPEPKTSSVWQGARFSQDQDGKLTAKFQRLMGIKKDGNGSGDSPSGSEVRQEKDIIKKQEELFSSMELQYEVARQATHTQRGVGLGFGVHHFAPK